MRSFLKNRLTLLEKVFFVKHLSMFLKAGIPLPEALASLAEEKEAGLVGKVARSVRRQIENGQSLSRALSLNSRSFDLFFVSMTEIGEVSGTLEKSLDFLATKLSREDALRKKIQAILYYPAVVVTIACAIGAFISFFVLPKLGDMFKSFDVQLPLITRILLFLADVSKKYGVVFLVTIILLLISFNLAVRFWTPFRFLWHKIKFRIPFFGGVVSASELSAFFRNIGIMLSSGLSIEYALRTEAEVAENLVIKKAAKELHLAVTQGKSLGEVFPQLDKQVFPPLVARMVLVGEASGRLEESFLYLADFFEDETGSRAQRAAVILEPLLLVFIGLVVAFVALAVILPIYSLTGSIHQ